LEWTGQEFVFHRFFRSKRFSPNQISQFKVEPIPGRRNGPPYPAVVAYTADGRVQTAALEFVRPGWRETVLGPQLLTWRGGSTLAIEETLNGYLQPPDRSRAAAKPFKTH
jgi:hypothetical protein